MAESTIDIYAKDKKKKEQAGFGNGTIEFTLIVPHKSKSKAKLEEFDWVGTSDGNTDPSNGVIDTGPDTGAPKPKAPQTKASIADDVDEQLVPMGQPFAVQIELDPGVEYEVYHSTEVEPTEDDWADPSQTGILATSLPVQGVTFTGLSGTYTGAPQDMPSLTAHPGAPAVFYLVLAPKDGNDNIVVTEPLPIVVQ